jgi:hypothetical protein
MFLFPDSVESGAKITVKREKEARQERKTSKMADLCITKACVQYLD